MNRLTSILLAAACCFLSTPEASQAAPVPFRLEMTSNPTGIDGLYDYTLRIINSTSPVLTAYLNGSNVPMMGIQTENDSVHPQEADDGGSSSSASSPTGSSSSAVGTLGSASSSESASNYTSSSSSSACEFLGGCTSSAAATCPIDGDNNTIDNSSTSSSLCGSGSSTDSGPFLSLGPLFTSRLVELGTRSEASGVVASMGRVVRRWIG